MNSKCKVEICLDSRQNSLTFSIFDNPKMSCNLPSTLQKTARKNPSNFHQLHRENLAEITLKYDGNLLWKLQNYHQKPSHFKHLISGRFCKKKKSSKIEPKFAFKTVKNYSKESFSSSLIALRELDRNYSQMSPKFALKIVQKIAKNPWKLF